MRREYLELVVSWANANIYMAAFVSVMFQSGIVGLGNALAALGLASYGLYMAKRFGIDDQ